MAIYRQIHIDFWQDELVADFTPEDKYFFLYLMTNGRTTQSGVYRINIRMMAFDLGWDKTTVEKMIDRFVKYGRIKYNELENEIFIVNWLKYNSARSPKVATVIDKQLLDIKTEEFKIDVITLCIQYGYPIRTISQPEPEPEPTKEPEPEPKTGNTVGRSVGQDEMAVAIQTYESMIGVFPIGLSEELKYALDEFGMDLLTRSFKIAAENNKRTWSYVKGIHRSWSQAGIDSIQRLEALELERKKTNEVLKGGAPTTFKPTFE